MKLVKTVAIGLSIVLLSGCYQRTDAFDIRAAKQFCKEQNSDVKYINAWIDGDETVRCTNGKSSRLNKYLDEYKNKLISDINKGE